jgi:hypothetical protein
VGYGFRCRLCGRVYASVEGVLACLLRHGVSSGSLGDLAVRVPLRRCRRVSGGQRRLDEYAG